VRPWAPWDLYCSKTTASSRCPLVDPVKALYEPDDVIPGAQAKGEADTVDAKVGHQPGDAAGDEPLVKSDELAGVFADP
jgi:hypothetical protein